jgi:hypothetical protein
MTMNIVVSKGAHLCFFWCQPIQSLWVHFMYHVYNDGNPFLHDTYVYTIASLLCFSQ